MSSSDSESGQDDDFSDWASSLHGAKRTKSLFDDAVLDSPEEAVEYDARVHGFDLSAVGTALGLTDYQRIMLVNHIRRNSLPASQLANLSVEDTLFGNDENLKPEIENDPLLQLAFDDSWSDDEREVPSAMRSGPTQTTIPPSSSSTTKIPPAGSRSSKTPTDINSLRRELEQERLKVKTLQSLIARDLEGEVSSDSEFESSDPDSESGNGMDKGKGRHVGGSGRGKVASGKAEGRDKGKGMKRDDDTHYFDSYASNDIHEIMLKDTVRTVSYGKFILGNPAIFKDAIVMDVGCGTGILSMFAARAGAKKVYAIEASGLASKARENIKRNGLLDVIEIIQGKVEEVRIPVDKVDVIISEWMGYMLLYESMLDSVLFARDNYLKPSGLMVPSQTRIVIAGATGARLDAESFAFWDSVYGFDLSAMKPSKVSEGIVDYVPADEIVTSSAIIKDIDTHRATVGSLDFVSDFRISPRASEASSSIAAFVTWFDTFFASDPTGNGQAGADVEVDLERYEGFDIAKSVVVGKGSDVKRVSFTTGPQGQVTHWKQVTFKLPEAVQLSQGQSVKGSFHCQKAKGNSRELDVEIHWEVLGTGTAHNAKRYDVYQVC